MRTTTIFFTAVTSVFIGAALSASLSAVGGCAHPAQSALHAGQCLLDNGVLAEVLAALAQPDYLKQVEAVGLRRADDLVDCALQAVAATPARAGSAEARAMTTSPDSDVLAGRANEVLSARRVNR